MAKPRVRTADQQVGVPEARKTGPIIAGVIVGVLVAFVGVALLIAQPWKSDKTGTALDSALEFQAVTVKGNPIPPDPSSAGKTADTGIGMVGPEIQGKTFLGKPIDIKVGPKPKVVMFFAHWCPHCQKEVPIIGQWLNDNKGKYDVDYYAVSTGASAGKGNYPPSKWFNKEKFPLDVLADNSNADAANAYGLSSYPYLVFLDKDNKLVARNSSEITPDQITSYVKQIATPAK